MTTLCIVALLTLIGVKAPDQPQVVKIPVNWSEMRRATRCPSDLYPTIVVIEDQDGEPVLIVEGIR